MLVAHHDHEGVIEAGGACDLILYDAEKHDDFIAATSQYDALIVRINPGQLSQGTLPGTQANPPSPSCTSSNSNATATRPLKNLPLLYR